MHTKAWLEVQQGSWLRPEPGPLPAWLVPVLAPVLRDLQSPTPVPFSLGFIATRGRARDGTLWARERDGTGVGIAVSDRGDPAPRLAELADQLQEFLSETAAGWGQARPGCPGHGHPPRADVVDGVAVWTCPDTDEVVARIGAAAPVTPD